MIAVGSAQYWGQQQWARPQAYRAYGGNVGYRGQTWAQPSVGWAGRGGYGYGGSIAHGGAAYGRAYVPRAVPQIAYGGAYGGAYGAPYGGVYAPVARVAGVQPQWGRYAGDESYKPYSFGFNSVDEYGTQLGRQEVADGSGGVRGSYSYRDPAGQFRQVQYEADGNGFRANVDTNEAGVVSHKPADAVYTVHK